MAGVPWNDDDPADAGVIAANALALVRQIHADSSARASLTPEVLRDWHRRLYAGCSVPVPGYVGHFRGDSGVPELVDYEVQVDGILGARAAVVETRVGSLLTALSQALAGFDAQIRVETVPDRAEIRAILLLGARVHGEWVRIHPFANGNGRTARVIVAWLALRYNLPVFLNITPRPTASDYAAAAQISMGSPQQGQDRDDSMARVFAHMLRTLLGP